MKNALISVSDKRGIEDFARRLVSLGWKIFSTGGTADTLRKAGVPVTEVADYTGFPEVLGGRVKTLHPRVHGGLLYKRGDPKHEAEARECGFEPIDLVVVNLYPFEQTIAKEGVTREEAIEKIDIGGPAMLRSAAKNHESVVVIVDPADYEKVLDQMKIHGDVLIKLRSELAAKVFLRTSEYDSAIGRYLNRSNHERFDS